MQGRNRAFSHLRTLAAVVSAGAITSLVLAQGGSPPPQPACVITEDAYACDGLSYNSCPVTPIDNQVCHKVHARDCNNADDRAAVGNQASTFSSSDCTYYKQTMGFDGKCAVDTSLAYTDHRSCRAGSGTNCPSCPTTP